MSATISRMRKTLRRIKRYTPEVQGFIKRNIRLGLLCACNATRVPYYGEGPTSIYGEEHGTTEQDGIIHGYDDCRKAGEE